MRKPLFVRTLSDSERQHLEAGLRSADAFVLRRCQILLASSRGQRATAIAQHLGCDDETVRDVIKAFHARGLAALQRRSRRPHRIAVAFSPAQSEQLRDLLHQSPRNFGQPTGVWTLELAAEVSFEQGLTQERVSREAVRTALSRLGVKWQRAKQWITSPDPAYERKKSAETG
jgi:transposase